MPTSISEPALTAPPELGWVDPGDGAHLRTAWWPLPGVPRGTVLLLNGRCEFIERYQEIAGEWRARGYQVFSCDWRGQGRSSRLLPHQPQKGHLGDYRQRDADLDQVFAQLVAPRVAGPLVLFGHSMGGLIGLRHLLAHPGRYAAAVLSSPMLDFNTAPFPRWFAKTVALGATTLGFGRAYAFGQGDYDPQQAAQFETNPATGDRQRFLAFHQQLEHQPELRVGGVTFGWLAASFRALDHDLPRAPLEQLTLPVLILSSLADRLVPAASHQRLARRLPRAELHGYTGLRHEPLMEPDVIRARIWADLDGFLRRAGLPPEGPAPAPALAESVRPS